MERYNELLKLAREAIIVHFNGEDVKVSEEVKKKFGDRKACFVTLTEDGELRGCIGILNAYQELWEDVVDNAVNAGFGDPRFEPLDKNELGKIKIEISILSTPEKLKYKDSEDLLKKLDSSMGIILKNGIYSATFLPQVWKEIPDKTEFLEHLARKAGLGKDDWKDSEFEFYKVESVKE